MALSYTSLSGGSGGAASNDFTVTTGASGYTKSTFSTSFPAGSYVITSALSDTTYDIYLVAEDGTNAGYVNAAAASTNIVASVSFNSVVIYGASSNDTLTFQFKYVFGLDSASSSDFTAAPPKITSLSTAAMPTAGNSTTVTGFNFATDVTATFTGTDSVDRLGSVSRSSSTSISVTRPATLPEQYAPYTFTLSNPGIANPTSSNVHKLTSYITTKPSIPTIGTPSVTGDTTVSIPFTAPTSTGGSAITGYTIVSSPSIALSYNTSSTTSPIVVTGTFVLDTTYTFTIAAVNANGTSAASSASSGVIPLRAYSLTQTFNASGNFTVPAGKTKMALVSVGAGGGGSGSYSANNGSNPVQFGGQGGGGGGLAIIKEITVTPSTVYAVTIGSGGNGGSGTHGNSTSGNAGGVTNFGSIFTANAGNGGVVSSQNVVPAAAGTGGNIVYNTGTAAASSSGASGGAGGTWNTSSNGSVGSASSTVTSSDANISSYSQGGGGGGGGQGVVTNNPNQAGFTGGSGGASRGGTGGNGGYVVNSSVVNGNSGSAGTSYGGGGGGGGGAGSMGGNNATPNGFSGGSGSGAQILVYTKASNVA